MDEDSITDQTVVTTSAVPAPPLVILDAGDKTVPDPQAAALNAAVRSATDAGTGVSSADGATQIFFDHPAQIGRYRLRRHVGSGAMGDVYEAHDPQLDRQVAVKVPRCERLSRNRRLFTERFVREARAAAAVRHAHICPIYDAGEQDGQPYVVMAFVAGETLESVLSRGRIEDVRSAVDIAIQVADALAAIHEHGIIHRDLKPGNILIDNAGQALLTDFGLALSEVNNERITTDGLIVGTPVYMSPEQAAGENSRLTAAADLYSLGAVLYEMLAGEAPFRAPLPDLLRKILLESPRPLCELRPEVDEPLSAIVMQTLAKSPSDRHRAVKWFAGELREWLGSTASGIAPRATDSTVDSRTTSRSRRRAALVAATMTVAAASIASVMAWNAAVRDGDSTTNSHAAALKPADDQKTLANASLTPALPDVPRELSGNLTITISSDPQKGPVTKSRLPASEPGALPLRTGELVRFEVRLNQPGFIYLIWVSPDGSVTPLYPWDAEHFAGWDAPHVAGSERTIDHIVCPVSPNRGFEAVDPVGLQTVVLLARRRPLEQGVDLAQLLSGLPATPELAMNTVRGPILRGVKTGQTKSTQDGQFDELEARVGSHFEFMRVLSFPQEAAPAAGQGLPSRG
jgi:serine/threonine protein kinase